MFFPFYSNDFFPLYVSFLKSTPAFALLRIRSPYLYLFLFFLIICPHLKIILYFDNHIHISWFILARPQRNKLRTNRIFSTPQKYPYTRNGSLSHQQMHLIFNKHQLFKICINSNDTQLWNIQNMKYTEKKRRTKKTIT